MDNSNKPYFCTKCSKTHYRGKIFENHLKYKEKDKEIPKSDSFIMRGKKGEELKVKVDKISEELRIHIYKNDSLACSTYAPVNKSLLKRKNIRKYIKNHCF